MPADEAVLARFRKPGHDHRKCVREALATADSVCAAEGVSLTPLRRRVLELVWGAHAPVRAYDLLESLRAERRGAAPPTVYRALDFLLSVGLIHRIESLNAFVGCADPVRRHRGQFLICEQCGAVAELDDDEIANSLAARANALGFKARRQTIEIAGSCPACQGSGSRHDG
jgi:Fur family transcriptional regulator, zinc uptake regulator